MCFLSTTKKATQPLGGCSGERQKPSVRKPPSWACRSKKQSLGGLLMLAELLGSFGNDLMVVNAARVSHGKWKNEFDHDRDTALIRYLARNKHESPFFHPQVQFRITAPIFIARQWFRHEVGFSRNEVSRRYVDDEPAFFFPDQWRSRPEGSIKQGSGEPLHANIQDRANDYYTRAGQKCFAAYDEMLRMGVAPEQARMVLPQSMETQWVETGSLMAYARLCRLRIHHHAQVEIQNLAKEIHREMGWLFPVSWEALMEIDE